MATILGNINAALSKVKLTPTPAKVAPKPLTLRTSAPTPVKVAPKPLTLRGAAPAPAPAAGPVHLQLKPMSFAGTSQAQLTAPPSPVDNTPVAPEYTLGGASPDASGAVTGSGVGGGTDAAAAPSPTAPTDTTTIGFQMTPAMWGLGALAALALVAIAVAGHHGYDVNDVG